MDDDEADAEAAQHQPRLTLHEMAKEQMRSYPVSGRPAGGGEVGLGIDACVGADCARSRIRLGAGRVLSLWHGGVHDAGELGIVIQGIASQGI